MAKNDNVKEAKTIKTVEELREDLKAKVKDLNEAKRGLASGELANPRIIRTLRREIARLNTAIRADELGRKEK
jgi:ribosomal protein L29